jgi:catalase-peroxidase
MDGTTENMGAGKCPVAHGRAGRTNRDWWPNQLSLQMLNQHSPRSNPLGEAFD